MRKNQSLFALILVLSVLFAACSGPKTLPDEPYTPVEYKLYPCPEGAYVGDTMPFVTDDGTLELYYLYDTDHNGQGYHPIYKYSTTNFCGYVDASEQHPASWVHLRDEGHQRRGSLCLRLVGNLPVSRTHQPHLIAAAFLTSPVLQVSVTTMC